MEPGHTAALAGKLYIMEISESVRTYDLASPWNFGSRGLLALASHLVVVGWSYRAEATGIFRHGHEATSAERGRKAYNWLGRKA